MANTQAICDSFRVDLLNGTHAFGAQGANGVRTVTTKDVFKAALYLATATKDRTTTVYNTTGELAGTGNYTQGGVTVTNATAPTNTGGTGVYDGILPPLGSLYDGEAFSNSQNTASWTVSAGDYN